MPGIDPFASITAAILDLLMRDGDLFLRLGTNLFRGVAIILLAWFGIRAALASAEGGAALPIGPFVSLILTIAFGFTMITYYRAPIPGIGISFTQLLTDQPIFLARALEVTQVQRLSDRLNELYLSLEQPLLFNVSALVGYFLVALAVTADAGAVIDGLAALMQPIIADAAPWRARNEEFFKARAALWAEREASGARTGKPLHPDVIYAEIRKAAPRNAIFTLDAGTTGFQATDQLPCYEAPALLTPLDCGMVGFSYAAAIGAKVAAPRRAVISLMGGHVQMSAPIRAASTMWMGCLTDATSTSVPKSNCRKISTICAMSAMPSVAMSSSRPTNGLTYAAPTLAAMSACVAEKINVVLIGIPSPESVLMAFTPSRVNGIFTTTCSSISRSERPSAIMPAVSVATTVIMKLWPP